MKTVILDLDDTLANLRVPMQKVLDKYSKKTIPWQSWDSFYITDLYGITEAELYSSLIDSGILSDIEPYEDTKETLNALKQLGHNIVIVTSRNYHPDAYNVTKTWFEKHGLPYDKIHISGHGVKKSSFANQYSDVVMAVDDNIDNCNDFIVNSNINKTLLMNMPWNSANKDIKRIHQINEMLGM